MADFKEREQQQQERKIPVFTVQKNGAILKNIFVLNSPISPPSPPSVFDPRSIDSVQNEENPDQEEENEEVVIVGRHPDCNIVLAHPSISRFHLQINSNPFSQKLSVIDLGSVHGTWVSGNKIEPGVRVELAEGDTLKFGGSTRVYRLHWVPLSCAYDMESPFISALDVTMTEDKQEESSMQGHQEETAVSTEFKHTDEKVPLVDKRTEETYQIEETCQGENILPFEREGIVEEDSSVNEGSNALQGESSLSMKNLNIGGKDTLIGDGEKGETCKFVRDDNTLSLESKEIQQQDLILDGMNSLFSNDISGSVVIKKIPLVPPMPENMKTAICDEKEEDKQLQYDHEAMEIQPMISSLQYDKSNVISNCNMIMNSLFSDDNSGSVVIKEIPSAPPMPENMTTTISDGKEEDKQSQYDHEAREIQPMISFLPVREALSENKHENESPPPLPALQLPSEIGNQDLMVDQSLNQLMKLDSACDDKNGYHLAEKVLEGNETQSISGNDYLPRKISSLSSLPLPTESVNSSNPASELPSEIADYKESQTPQSFFVASGKSKIENLQSTTVQSQERSALGSIWSRRGKPPTAIQIQTDKGRRKTREDNAFVGVDEKSQENVENRSIAKTLFSGLEGTEDEVYTPDKENFSPNTLLLKSLKKSDKSRRRTREDNVEDKSEENVETRSIAQSLFSGIEGAEDEVYTPDKENFSPNTLLLKSLKKGGKPGELKNSMSSRLSPSNVFVTLSIQPKENTENFRQEEGLEEEVYTPDKENFSPHTLRLKSSKKNGNLGESKHSKSSRLSCSNGTVNLSFQPEECTIAFSDEENHAAKFLHPRKSVKPTLENQVKLEQQTVVTKGRAKERVPFQSLLQNSARRGRSEASVSAATRSGNFVHCTRSMEARIIHSHSNYVGEGKRSWTMVVDTASLLDKESRKSLQLLQGLKGTQIIIPRMVIRDLDCLKRQGSLFRRRTEVSAVLDWIEECMVKTNWWIHVQSSVEEGRSIAPTPPATPQSQFCEESGGISCGPFSTRGSLFEIVTPTAEDHILDCALLFRMMKKDGQLVLLSNDVTLKIKAMAEGLLCETAQEFRESLLNPFSERFLWTDSSPRGRTWSHLDDVVLREKYNHFSSRKSFKGEGAKGLKLILLHNSQYGQKTSAR